MEINLASLPARNSTSSLEERGIGQQDFSKYKILLGRMEEGKPLSTPALMTSGPSQLGNTHAVPRMDAKSRKSESE